ncbi:MAG: T9SS type A sorting domain-containing protein, partial [candidate division WOR-3 bacterium]|nr:T9SS type A sorting domain-containing protein [candidate division WOR-3 bacterium]
YSHIRFSKSINGGNAFEVSKKVADTTGDFGQLFPKIIRDNKNVIHAIWQDGRNADNNSDIFYAYLLKNENSFSKNIKVNCITGKANYGNKYPTLTIANDNIFTAWQGSTSESYWHIYFSKAKFVPQSPTFVQETRTTNPCNFILYQNYPNPFNPTTKIEYSLHTHSHVILKVYNILGEEIETLINKQQPAGNYVVEFQSKNLSSGVYFYKLQVGNNSSVKKMVIVR